MPETPAPREVKVHYRKSAALWMTLGITLVLLFCAFKDVSFLAQIENKTIDLRFEIRGPRTPKAPVKIVAIDEKSLGEIGQWPWPRAVHAEMLRRLKADGVKCVFYDVFFPEPERTQERMLGRLKTALDSSLRGSSRAARTARSRVLADIRRFQETQDGDKVFGKAIRESGNVFLPLVPFTGVESKEGRSPGFGSLHATPARLLDGSAADFFPAETLLVSIPTLQDNVEDTGGIRYLSDLDGIFRYYPTAFSYQGKLIPHLALQVARYFLGDKNPVGIEDGEYAEVGGRRIPVLSNNFAFINYCGPKGTIPTVSAADVLAGRLPAGLLEGSVVLIGATAAGLFDLRPTPFTHNSPGVEINANILENVIDGAFMTLAPQYWKILLVVGMALLMWFLVPRVTPLQGTVVFVLLLAGYAAASCLVFTYLKTVINVVYPSLSLLLTFVALTTYKFRTEVRHGRYLKQMFQSMVAPQVVEEILRLPAGIELGGEEKQLTVMFSDIRGFTTYSEKHSPHEVVEVLNEYLTQMTNLIFQTEGTLDKYIGDAIMAFWGAPTAQKDNAYRACSTALGMVDLLHSVLHPKWEMEGKEKLQIGVGLNTGPMVVGFVGSESIKNYTLIGDAVNLGSRLEGTTKEYQVEIVISQSTYEQVKSDMLCRELDLIRVKGKNEPIRIYELMDHRLKGAGNREMKARAFEAGLALYRERRFEEAAKRFQNCLDLDPKDGPARIFIDRCGKLQKTPPPEGWDGVFTMKTK